jgi:hypothetical protein
MTAISDGSQSRTYGTLTKKAEAVLPKGADGSDVLFFPFRLREGFSDSLPTESVKIRIELRFGGEEAKRRFYIPLEIHFENIYQGPCA